MRFAIFALLAIAAVSAKPSEKLLTRMTRVEEDVITQFIECVRTALKGGLASAEIPDHDPFVWNREITIPVNEVGLTGTVTVGNMSIENIPAFNTTQLEGSYYDSDLEFNIVYELYWKAMQINGQFVADVDDLIINHHYVGTFNVSLNDLVFAGLWDSTTAVDHRRLVDLTIAPTVTSSPVTVKGTGILNDPIVGSYLTTKIRDTINSQPDEFIYGLVPLVRDRINENWLADNKTYRIDAIIANCQ